jgi:hypothetical protein
LLFSINLQKLKNAILKPAYKKRGLVKPENGSLKYADSFYWLKQFRHVFPHAQGIMFQFLMVLSVSSTFYHESNFF